jgi:chromosome segregation ATPase
MADYLDLACPSCQKALRVRRQYIGQRVSCKYCNQPFKVTDPVAPPPAAPEASSAAPQIAALEQQLQQLRADLSARNAEKEQLAQQVQLAQSEAAQTATRLHELQSDRDRIQQQFEAARSELGTLKEGASRVEQDLGNLRTERERLDKEQLRLQAQVEMGNIAQKERDRLSAELQSALTEAAKATSNWKTESAQLRSRIEELERDLAQAKKDREELRNLAEADRQKLNTEWEQKQRTRDLKFAKVAKQQLFQGQDTLRQEFHQERTALLDEINKVRKLADTHGQERDEAQKNLESLRQELATTREERERVDEQLRQRQVDLEAMNLAQKERERLATELEEVLAETTKSASSFKLEAEERRVKGEELERLLNDAKDNFEAERLRLLGEWEKDRAGWAIETEETRKKFETIGLERDQVREQMTSLLEDLRTLQDHASQTEQERDQLLQNLDAIRAEGDILRMEFTAYKEGVSRKEEEWSLKLETAQEESSKSASTWQQETDTLRDQLDDLVTKLSEAKQEHETVRTRFAEEKAMLLQTGEQTETLRSRIHELERQLTDASRDHETEKTRFAEEKTRLLQSSEQFRHQLEEGRQRAEALVQELDRVKVENADLNSRLNEKTQHTREDVNRLTAQLEQMCKEHEAAVNSRQEMAVLVQSLRDDIEKQKSREAELLENLQFARAELEQANAQLLHLRFQTEHTPGAGGKDGMEQVMALMQWEADQQRERLEAELAQCKREMTMMRDMLWGLGVKVR